MYFRFPHSQFLRQFLRQRMYISMTMFARALPEPTHRRSQESSCFVCLCTMFRGADLFVAVVFASRRSAANHSLLLCCCCGRCRCRCSFTAWRRMRTAAAAATALPYKEIRQHVRPPCAHSHKRTATGCGTTSVCKQIARMVRHDLKARARLGALSH